MATACASAANAIGDAFKAIQYGDADVMVTGGTEAALTPMGISGFASMRALSERNDDPQRASRPFDRDRDGFVLSEGAGLLGDRRARARQGTRRPDLRRGVGLRPQLPTAATSPSPTSTAPAPPRRWLAPGGRSCRRRRRSVTSTPTAPARRWATRRRPWPSRSVFRSTARKISISSTKSQLGHLLGASGGVELMLSMLGAARQRHSAHDQLSTTPDPACDLDYTPNQARERKLTWPCRTALASAATTPRSSPATYGTTGKSSVTLIRLAPKRAVPYTPRLWSSEASAWRLSSCSRIVRCWDQLPAGIGFCRSHWLCSRWPAATLCCDAQEPVDEVAADESQSGDARRCATGKARQELGHAPRLDQQEGAQATRRRRRRWWGRGTVAKRGILAAAPDRA